MLDLGTRSGTNSGIWLPKCRVMQFKLVSEVGVNFRGYRRRGEFPATYYLEHTHTEIPNDLKVFKNNYGLVFLRIILYN